jgi:hypothetical protein
MVAGEKDVEGKGVYRSMIGVCGDNCEVCPRYVATMTGDVGELRKVAEMWFRIGWRDSIVSVEEISCTGCRSLNLCRYDQLRRCAWGKESNTCGECADYPCRAVEEVFVATERYANICRERLSSQDYRRFDEAFFSKQRTLDRIRRCGR